MRACVPLRALIETFSNTFFRAIPRTSNLGKSSELVLAVTFACILRFEFQLQDNVLAVSGFIARDQSDLPASGHLTMSIMLLYLFAIYLD